MYIFTREREIDSAHTREATTDAVDVAAKVTDITGLPVAVWLSTYDPFGSRIMWSARVETMKQLDGAWTKLFASDDYLDDISEIAESFVGPTVDGLYQLTAGTMSDEPAAFVSLVRATAANGQQRAAVHWGADLASRASTALDVPVAFLTSAFGTYGGLAWATPFNDIEAVEGTRNKLMSEDMIQAVVDEGGHFVQPGATQVLLRRLN